MALVPHKTDEVGRKAFEEKLSKAKKGGTKADAVKLKEENNIDLGSKPKVVIPEGASAK